RPALIAAVLVAALCFVPSAAADPISTLPPVLQPAPTLFGPAKPTRSESSAVALFLAAGKVHDWVGPYPKASRGTEGDFHPATADWTIGVWSGKAGEIASGRVDDRSGKVTEAWTGPQVAWAMARGQPGAFGGKEINSWPVWLAFSAVFLLGL